MNHSPQRSSFPIRRERPGLSDVERMEIPSFIRDVVCPKLKVSKPPMQVLEMSIWATLMWLLDGYQLDENGNPVDGLSGPEWMYQQSHIISSCHDFGIAFLHSLNWEGPPNIDKIKDSVPIGIEELVNDSRRVVSQLTEALKYLDYEVEDYFSQSLVDSLHKFQIDENIDPRPVIDQEFYEALEKAIEGADLLNPANMQSTGRPVGSCSSCGSSLWCVKSYMITDKTAKGYNYLCNACALNLDENMDVQDVSGEATLSRPKCDGCMNQECPHLATYTDQYGRSIPQIMVDMGKERIERYSAYLAGTTDGNYGGLTSSEITTHFTGKQLDVRS